MSIESVDWDNLTWEERGNYNLKIFEVFDEKGYNSVNLSGANFLCMLPSLSMYTSEAKKLAKDLKSYDVEILIDPLNKFHAEAVIYKDGVHVHPASLIDVFKTLPVKGGKK